MSDAPKGKQPSFILEQEITGRTGKVYATRVGAMFEREDGSHGVRLESVPLIGDLVARTPAQRIEQIKARASQAKDNSAEQDIER